MENYEAGLLGDIPQKKKKKLKSLPKFYLFRTAIPFSRVQINTFFF